MATPNDKEIWDSVMDDSDLGEDIKRASTEEINNRIKLLENDIKIMKSDQLRLTHEQGSVKAKIKENQDKVQLSKQLPYLVANVVELLPVDPNDEPEADGANVDLDSQRKGISAVVKTSTRQVIKFNVDHILAHARVS
jgi:26S proteasome regulatory subunit T5